MAVGAGIGAGLLAQTRHKALADSAATQDLPGKAMQDKDLLVNASAKALAAGIRAKKVSSVELVQAYLDRIEEINPWLNAVINLTAESALAEAAKADVMLQQNKAVGPLHGVPMTLKDSLDTSGVVTTWSVPERSEHVPVRDATVVARLKAAGVEVPEPRFTKADKTRDVNR